MWTRAEVGAVCWIKKKESDLPVVQKPSIVQHEGNPLRHPESHQRTRALMNAQSINISAVGSGFPLIGKVMGMPAFSAVFFMFTPTACSGQRAKVG
jgi:hypothetical protein